LVHPGRTPDRTTGAKRAQRPGPGPRIVRVIEPRPGPEDVIERGRRPQTPLTTPLGTRILGCLSSRRRRTARTAIVAGGARHLRPNDPVTDVPRPMWEGNDGEDGATLLSPTVSGSWSDGGGGGGRDGGDAGRSGAGARRGAGTAACPDGPAGAPKTSPRGTAAHRAGVRPRHLGRGHRLVPQLDGRRPRLLPAPRPVRRADAPRQVPARRGPPAAGEREPAQRVVLEVLDQGRALRDACGQARRDQGQRVRGPTWTRPS